MYIAQTSRSVLCVARHEDGLGQQAASEALSGDPRILLLRKGSDQAASSAVDQELINVG